MHLRRRAFGRKAVSPLLATIILIAITVAAGLVIYNLFFSTAGVASQNLQCMVSVDLIRPGGTATYAVIAISVKNSGSVPITGITVQWIPEGLTSLQSLTLSWNPSVSGTSPLAPGQTASASTTFTTAANLPIVGKSYPFVVRVDGAGQSSTTSLSVPCAG
jgi:flagellin-like protein/uncharacterized repeat protein (TIGR01451 family)